MTKRERTMALTAMLLLFVFGGGLVAYQFFLQPMKSADKRIISLSGEVEAKENDGQVGKGVAHVPQCLPPWSWLAAGGWPRWRRRPRDLRRRPPRRG